MTEVISLDEFRKRREAAEKSRPGSYMITQTILSGILANDTSILVADMKAAMWRDICEIETTRPILIFPPNIESEIDANPCVPGTRFLTKVSIGFRILPPRPKTAV